MTKKDWFIFIALTIFGVVISAVSLFQTHYAPGWDSYFYMDQVKHWFETGELHSSRTNVIYPLLIGLQYLFSDYVISYKVLTAIAYSLCAPVIFLIGRNLQLGTLQTILVAWLFIVNPISLYFACQFTKNTLGFLFLLFFLLSLIQKRKISTVLWLVMLALSHKLMFVIAVLIGFQLVLFTQFKKPWIKVITPLLLWLLAFTGFYMLAPHNLGDLHFPLLSFHQSHEAFLTSLTFYWGYVSVLIVLYLFLSPHKLTRPILSSLMGVCFFLLMPFLEWDVLGYSYRFLMVFLMLSPLLLWCISIKGFIIKRLILPVSLVLCFWGSFSYNPEKQDPPYRQYSFIAESVKGINSDLIVAHKGLAEFISFHTGKDVMPWEISTEEITTKSWRLAYVPHAVKRKIESHLGTDYKKITSRYYLLKAEKWHSLLSLLDEKTKKTLLTWRNPHDIRTSALIK